MNTTYNPKADAEQARIYRDAVTPNTAVPEAMRAMAEKMVDRSREAYDRSKDALDASVVTFERSFDAAGQGAVAFNRKFIDITQRNADGLLAEAAEQDDVPSRGSSRSDDEG